MAKDSQTTSVPAPTDVTYTVEEFRNASRKLFGYGPEVIDGAIYGNTKEAFTVKEMERLVKSFLGKPVTAKEGD